MLVRVSRYHLGFFLVQERHSTHARRG
jgi:hypothetical protein